MQRLASVSQEVLLRKFAATLAALLTTAAALTAPTPAHADDPGCTGTSPLQITSMTWSPPQVTAGQPSTLTIVVQNCTDTTQQGWYSINREFLGSGPGVPPGCPTVEPSPPSLFGLAPRGTYRLGFSYDTYADCTATRLLGTVKITNGNTLLDEESANLEITPRRDCAVTYRTTWWTGGFIADVTIANIADTPINGWALTFDLPGDQRIVDGWNAIPTQTGTTVKVINEWWNATIPPAGTEKFQLLGTWQDIDAPPTAFALNGAPCELR
jgi:hypothetical protein